MTAKTFAARKTEKGQQSFWDRTIHDLKAQLHRHGANEVEIEKQITSFRDAVSAELCRQEGTEQKQQ